MQTDADRTSATITLPAPQLSPPRVDPAQSRVVSRQRGVLDRLGGAFSDNPTSERELYLRAQEQMLSAARQGELLTTAQDNTRQMLRGLLAGLGYTEVTVRFRPAPRT